MKLGFLTRKGSMWIGLHYSPYHKRGCLNILPCLTVWFTANDGHIPYEAEKTGNYTIIGKNEYAHAERYFYQNQEDLLKAGEELVLWTNGDWGGYPIGTYAKGHKFVKEGQEFEVSHVFTPKQAR